MRSEMREFVRDTGMVENTGHFSANCQLVL